MFRFLVNVFLDEDKSKIQTGGGILGFSFSLTGIRQAEESLQDECPGGYKRKENATQRHASFPSALYG